MSAVCRKGPLLLPKPFSLCGLMCHKLSKPFVEFSPTRTVLVVIGNSLNERLWREEIQREFQRFQNQLMFVWGNEFTFDEILKRCAALPPNSAILRGPSPGCRRISSDGG